MLLSFYDFPKIESSTILTAQSKQNIGFRRGEKSSIPFENEIQELAIENNECMPRKRIINLKVATKNNTTRMRMSSLMR